MTTNFPASQDSFSRPTASSALTGHAALHDDLADAIEAVEAKVGSNSSAVTTSHDYKIAQLESTGLTTSTTFGGEVSGTYNNIVVGDDTHTHDTRYYTESEIDTKLTEATDSVVGLFKGIRGNGSYYVNGTGHATITFDNVGGTPVAAFVQTRAQVTTGSGGGEYVLSLPITNLTATTITFRAYEVNVANSNDNSQVSTIYTGTPSSIFVNVSWLVIV